MTPRAARALAALYPRAWRREYGEEFTDLLHEVPVSARTVANVTAHAGTAHLRIAGHAVAFFLSLLFVRPAAMCWRVVGYALSDDLHDVYGNDPNGTRDPNNVGGNLSANIAGGMR